MRLDRPGVAPDIAGLDRKNAALAFDHRRAAEERPDARAVDSRRHHQDFQILAQPLLGVARQSEPKVDIERTLVEFIEQHRSHARERRIVDDHARENALGDDLDAGLARDFRAEAHAQAHGFANRLAKIVRHARSGGARGEPARLEHQNAAGLPRKPRPWFRGKDQRHAGGFAGAGRRHQHRGIIAAQRRGQFRQCGVDGEGRGIHNFVRHSGARTRVREPGIHNH